MLKMGEEIATDTCEKVELTKFGKFCRKYGINSNLIMLKITLFVMYGGKCAIASERLDFSGSSNLQPKRNFVKSNCNHIRN